MSTMLDSNDFMLDLVSEDMGVAGDLDNNETTVINNSARGPPNNIHYDPNIGQNAHAGTGGSSKMRPRPY